MGAVHLRITDLARSLAFYSGLLGLKNGGRDESAVQLSAGEGSPLLLLTELAAAKPRPRHSTGLFHMAIRVPDRAELASVIRHLHSAHWPLHGFANHGVSESVYLVDPDENGIEIYADLPREDWRMIQGQIAMTTDPLDVPALLKLAPATWDGLSAATQIGHVHLQVSDLKKARDFYHDLLGFDVTQESYPGALFFSAGGYHHHVAVNIWGSRGGTPTPVDCAGLQSFRIVIPDAESLSALWNRLQEGGVTTESAQHDSLAGIAVYDRDNIRLEILTPAA
jgi:catechol 2,3-dioxygenase